jgi:hypothetical protein
MKLIVPLCLASLLSAVTGVAAAADTRPNDFPNVDRVLYVQACMRAHPGGNFYEMVNKCSCVLDHLASEMSFDDYTSMSTLVNANSIGGERGGVIRDNEPAQAQIKHYRELQTKAQKGCFLAPPGAK